jgi:hypothetical protein
VPLLVVTYDKTDLTFNDLWSQQQTYPLPLTQAALFPGGGFLDDMSSAPLYFFWCLEDPFYRREITLQCYRRWVPGLSNSTIE